MRTAAMKTILIAGILVVIIAVFVMICEKMTATVLNFILGFNEGVSGAKEFINRENYFNRRYLRIKSDGISYDFNSKSSEESEKTSENVRIVEYRLNQQPDEYRNLREFKKGDLVRCLDSLSFKRDRRPIHIAFIGDSTVRQHFFSFLRLIPDYDRKTVSNATTFAELAFHEDMNVTSHLLDNLRVSFYWRNLIRSDLIDDFRRWASTNDDSQAPDFILLGVTAHHLIVNNTVISNSLEMYEQLLKDELVPLLKQSFVVHPHQEIIWLRQSLTIEPLSPNDYQLAYGIYSDKIKKYNAILPRIFKGAKVVMWDAINAFVDEYIRACTLTGYHRRDKRWYENCNDIIHPGFGALSLGTHLFINHICASAISQAHQ